MNQSETPQITGSTSSATAYGLGDITTAMNTVRMVNAGLHPQNTQLMAQGRLASQYMKVQEDANQHWQNSLKQAQSVKELPMTARRLVQVYIADPDENLPLDHAMIYQGEQKLTDLTDQELFFEIDIATLLKQHNEYRTKQINKKVKERIEHLEPARIRDLKMVVVTVASF